MRHEVRRNTPPPARVVPDNGQALSAAERAAVLTLINSPAYADLSIGQIWARELDEGRYLPGDSRQDARVAGVVDSLADARVTAGLATALALLVVRVRSSVVRAWI